jgi:NADPH2:quinone reductase
MVGGDYLARNIQLVAVEGRIVQIAVLKGPKTEINLLGLMQKRAILTGSTLRPRPVADKAAIAAALKSHAWPLIEAGKVKPVIERSFPLAEASEAHRLMESSAHIGKILLVV